MTPREISTAAHDAARQEAPSTEARALVAMRDLLRSFIEATDKGCPESMKAMSIDQVRILNQLYLAAGL